MQRILSVLLAVVFAAGTAHAQDNFQRKSGLWEIKRTTTRTQDQVRTYRMCIDQSSDNALRQLTGGMRSEKCETSKTAREGDRLIVDATCKVSTTTATTHAVISGKFDTAYKIESKATFDPPLRGEKEGSAVIEAKWTGACKPDQKPGDLMMPNGSKINVANQDQPTEKAPRDKTKKRGGGVYVPPPDPGAAARTPAVPPPGTTTK